jgi:hypothetical protein
VRPPNLVAIEFESCVNCDKSLRCQQSGFNSNVEISMSLLKLSCGASSFVF